MQKKCVYNTWCSQAVTHLSTNHARALGGLVVKRPGRHAGGPVFDSRSHPRLFAAGSAGCHVSVIVTWKLARCLGRDTSLGLSCANT